MKHIEQVDRHRSSHSNVAKSEAAFTEFERALHHLTEAFGRWSVDLHAYADADGGTLLAQDVSVLHVIALSDRPKSVFDIAKFLNRADSANVLYGLRKLERFGLIEKINGPRRQVGYKLTDHGREVTDQYSANRRDILLTRMSSMADPSPMLEGVTERMWQLAGFYEQAARDLSVMTGLPAGEESRPKVVKHAAAEKSGARRQSAAREKKSARR